MTNAIDDIADAQVMLVTGSNTTENHPVLATFLKQNARRGGKLIVVDPRPIPLARIAWLHLQPNPGTDVALYNGMIREIIHRGLVDVPFVESRTEGFEALRQIVEPYDLDRVERITGVPRAKIEEAAVAYGKAERAAIYWGMGVSQHTTGSDNSFCLINLALLTGNVGKRGVGLNPLRGQNNVQGASDMGAIPMYYPGYQSAESPDVRAKFARAWGVPEAPARGLTVTEIMKAAGRGQIRGLYVMGENPILSDPDMNHVDDCVRALDFLAVQDVFLTETAEYADVVLPAASGLEKEGTYANTDRHVQMGRPVVSSPGDARQDWKIVAELSTRMGFPMPYSSVNEIQEEIRTLVPDYAGVSHARLARENVQWPAPSEAEPGMAIYETIPRGKGLLRAAEWLPAKELPNADYPFILNTGRVLEHWHTGTMTRRSVVLDAIAPAPFVEMNESDAKRLGLADGARVRVESRRGGVDLA
ncbi:MAG TPA: molybdopterin-dependent oxidoreductase, partial [Burkholderiales bacterium]|nr:molybdopterin-dependent oxidoreductase [Burkholderiales bacterium]